jgi:hypothetical protein
VDAELKEKSVAKDHDERHPRRVQARHAEGGLMRPDFITDWLGPPGTRAAHVWQGAIMCWGAVMVGVLLALRVPLLEPELRKPRTR